MSPRQLALGHLIIRRVGGLENETPLPQLAPLIIRRVGGLEIIKPFCFHTEGVNFPKTIGIV